MKFLIITNDRLSRNDNAGFRTVLDTEFPQAKKYLLSANSDFTFDETNDKDSAMVFDSLEAAQNIGQKLQVKSEGIITRVPLYEMISYESLTR